MSFFSYAPLPADLSLDRLLIKNPHSTFFWRCESSNFQSLGVFRGDILVVDKSLSVRQKDLVIISRAGEFYLLLARQFQADDELWGVVVGVIKCWR